MSSNSIGKLFSFSTWGESHGKAIGCVIDGVPSNIELNEKDIQSYLDKRKPGQSKYTTQRKEEDKVEILSGTFRQNRRFQKSRMHGIVTCTDLTCKLNC